MGESSKHTNIFVSLSVKKLIQENPDEISYTDLWGVLYVGRNKAGDQKLKIIGCYRYSYQLLAASHYYNYFHDATEFAAMPTIPIIASTALSASKHQHHHTTLMVIRQEINHQ